MAQANSYLFPSLSATPPLAPIVRGRAGCADEEPLALLDASGLPLDPSRGGR